MKKKRYKCFFIIFGAFLVLGVSFKVMTLIEGLTEVRPVNAIPPVAGLLCGPAGAAACGIANLFADLAGTISFASMLGVIGNFMAAWIPYRLWYLYTGEEPNLHSGKNILRYCLVCTVSAMSVAWILSFGLYALEGTWIRQIYSYVFFNNQGFSIGLGMPVLIMLTSDSVKFKCCGAPERYRFLKGAGGRKIILAVYGGCMAMLWFAVLIRNQSPEQSPWMAVVSAVAAAGLIILSV